MGSGGQCETAKTLEDCNPACKALFGRNMLLRDIDCGVESWLSDRPMRKEGFNLTVEVGYNGRVMANNSGHGGSGVAASWGCSMRLADELERHIPSQSKL